MSQNLMNSMVNVDKIKSKTKTIWLEGNIKDKSKTQNT